MMKCNSLYEEFRKFEGQPVKIFTDDEKVHCGIDMEAFESGVRILDDCNRPIYIDYSHIDAVVEPQMRLQKCCRSHCACAEDVANGDDYEPCDSPYDGERCGCRY